MTEDILYRICVVIFTALLFLVYVPLNRRTKKGIIWKHRLDDKVPYISLFVIPYLFFYAPLIVITFILWSVRGWGDFNSFLFSFLIIELVSYVVFITMPTEVLPHNVPGNGYFDKMIKKVYEHDKRMNAFPSIHVAITILCSYFLTLWYPTYWLLLLFVAVSIIISTVTIKQHYLVDIVGGIVVAFVGIFIGTVGTGWYLSMWI